MGGAVSAVGAAMAVAVLVVATSAASYRWRGERLASLARQRASDPPASVRRRPTGSELVVPSPLRSVLEDAALPVEPARAWQLWLTVGPPLAAVALVVGGVGMVVVASFAWFGVPTVVLVLRRGGAGRAVEAALPEALETMARALRSGAGARRALTDVASATTGRLGVELDRVVDDLAVGRSYEEALAAFERRWDQPGVSLAVAALLLGVEAGGGQARALDGVAEGIRARLAMAAEVHALASQARYSALVIALAPIAFAVLAAGADGGAASFLFTTPLGLVCLVAGLGLDGIGALWMHRIAEVDA